MNKLERVANFLSKIGLSVAATVISGGIVNVRMKNSENKAPEFGSDGKPINQK